MFNTDILADGQASRGCRLSPIERAQGLVADAEILRRSCPEMRISVVTRIIPNVPPFRPEIP